VSALGKLLRFQVFIHWHVLRSASDDEEDDEKWRPGAREPASSAIIRHLVPVFEIVQVASGFAPKM